jgi:hypothetical protein
MFLDMEINWSIQNNSNRAVITITDSNNYE